MKSHLVLGLLVATIIALPIGTGIASPGYRGVDNCVVSTISGETFVPIDAGPGGPSAANWDATKSKRLVCPVQIEQSSMNPTTASVRFTDFSGVDDLMCTPFVHDDAVSIGLGTKYSCGTAGGCTTAVVAWIGDGTLDFADVIGAITGDFAASFVCNLGKLDPDAGQVTMRTYELSH